MNIEHAKLIVIPLLALMFVFVYGYQRQHNMAIYDSATVSTNSQKDLPQILLPNKNNSVCLKLALHKPTLVKWVLKHSLKGKIYPRLAEDIVDTALDVEKGKYALVLLALMARESNFYVFSKSSAGALGLGQFTPTTIDTLIKKKVFSTKHDVYDPEKSIPAILVWLKEKGLKEDGSNLEQALIRYVGGSPKSPKSMRVAKDYVKDVKEYIGDLYLLLKNSDISG